MLDYTKEDPKTKNFIRKFWKSNDKIVVETLAKGKYKVEKTKAMEDYLMEREETEAQYIVNSKIYDKLVSKVNTVKDYELEIHMLMLIIISFVPSILFVVNINSITLLNFMIIILINIFAYVISEIGFQCYMNHYQNKIEDICKMEYYLENKEIYQTKNLKKDVMIKKLNMLSPVADFTDVININTIGDYRLEELEILRNNIIEIIENDNYQKTLKK